MRFSSPGKPEPKAPKCKKEVKDVIVELSPAAYVALCGLVQDALEHPSDATPLLKRVAQELNGAVASDNHAPEDGEDVPAQRAVG
jgi:hypothetical protein